ncbi:MAG: response regulator transcription factor [Eubacteriales bacterium]
MFGEKRCIFIVDDEIRMVRALKDFLKANGFHVLEAHNGEDALEIYYQYSTQIDLMLLDVMMPIMNGFEVLDELRANGSLTPIIMVTARGEEYDQVKGLKSGADDYITKPFSPTLLLARVETVLRRLGKNNESEIVAGEIILNTVKRSIVVKGEAIELTNREFELIHFFMLNQSLIFTREQILNSVWGYEFEGDSRTVDTHVKQLRIKLGDKASYIKTVHRVGYKFEV